MDYPVVVFIVSLLVLWLSCYAGMQLERRMGAPDEDERADFSVIVTSTLTLLGLIIGFTFSMAITRYDLRKNLEAAEANAIGTELARAQLLPAADATKVQDLLRAYLRQRIRLYSTRDANRMREIHAATGQIQADLWSAVQNSAAAQPNVIVALVVSGMNDVLNSQGYSQAAWWNRIPTAAWVLMGAIAICCNGLVGFTARRPEGKAKKALILPLIVSISFFLIADIDSPRGGVIRVRPQNLMSVAWPPVSP
jgi:hypothetical protein